MSVPTFAERKEAADAAKKAMLERFRSKPAVDPALAAQRAEQAKARDAKRAAAEEKRKARLEEEKTMRILEAEMRATEAAAEAKRAAEAAETARLAEIERLEILAYEQKAARDLRYAARKKRQK
jgi:Family of unknown function (DUF6481)